MERPLTALFPLVSTRKLEQLLARDRADLIRIAACAGRYYRSFDQRKIGSEKWRHIDNPRGELKCLQRFIHRKILCTATLPDGMLGSVKGKSIHDNHAAHIEPALLIAMDLRDCFPRTSDRKVFALYRDIFGCSPQIASILTRLTTFRHRLPQGAATSATLANLSLIPLYNDLRSLAGRMGLAVTFWVDDIAISGRDALHSVEPAIRIIGKHGHAVRRSKVKIMPGNTRQEVTGGVVNSKVSAGRKRISKIREKILKISPRDSVPNYELESIQGSILQIRSICVPQGEALQRFADGRLPVTGDKRTIRPPKFETRPCRCRRRRRSTATDRR
ncbi:MAG: RNA-directed DNA polymerase [bacterium]|nr:RNA-directed DNA polymerase [bacterium]